jgi:hypothetical protein
MIDSGVYKIVNKINNKKRNKYQAAIKGIFLGRFTTAEEASMKYQTKLKEIRGY